MTATERSPLVESNSAVSEPENGGRNSERSFGSNQPVVLIILATFLGEFLASADESLMTAIYTTVASEFRSLSQGSWLLVAYNFGYCISSPVYGLLGDLFGRKNIIIWSFCFFLVGCIACGASTSMIQLITARFLAGLSGAGVVSLVAVIITELVPPSDVAIFRSYGNTINIVGRSLGGPIGGFLSQAVGWRWYVFLQMYIAYSRSALIPTTVPYFIRVHNASDFTASLVNLAAMAGVPIASYLSGIWIKRTGRYKTMGLISACTIALVYLLVFFRWRYSCSPWEVLYLLPYGLAMGVLFTTQFSGMNAEVPTDRVGQCIGTYYLFQQLGRILGPVFGLSLTQQLFKGSLWKSLGPVPKKQELIQRILDDARFAITLPKPTQQTVRLSYLTGFQVVPLFGTLCTVLSFPLMILDWERS
ncbi:uncharacterized protein ATNIH1004_006628 [Aspergillus tanneri]|uniref:Major facilitator superfamily (MFS) profile domain-containing protein n=1 Tax=Aspergillus tanneri TaxID=1220188 RepID=A0A5M9MPV7_9EURO|nr:uncharacterized protein ATNIH1004_006628 [Aspergillus tanneri]KAA8647926.1 hypothetical protein ATNIH1004_006628 [Aspergillus tanneri]